MATLVRRRKLGMSSGKGISQFSKKGIGWCRNDKGIPEDDIYFRWGCTANLPNRDAKVVNLSRAIHTVSSKSAFRKKLADNGLAPATTVMHDHDIEQYEWDKDNEGKVFVARPHSHHQGRNIFKGSYEDCVNQLRKWNKGGGYITEFFDKTAEYRVFVVQGRAVCVAKKTPADEKALAWNVAQGGRFDNVRWDAWPLKAVKNSIKAFNLSGLDFGGVDVMVDKDGNTCILEINSAPSLTSPYRQECMAKAFDYIVENGKDPIPLIEERGGYKKFIHPAICKDAKLIN